jgi:hypothetical protein
VNVVHQKLGAVDAAPKEEPLLKVDVAAREEKHLSLMTPASVYACLTAAKIELTFLF